MLNRRGVGVYIIYREAVYLLYRGSYYTIQGVGGPTGGLHLLYLTVALYYTGRGFLYNIQEEGYIYLLYRGGRYI